MHYMCKELNGDYETTITRWNNENLWFKHWSPWILESSRFILRFNSWQHRKSNLLHAYLELGVFKEYGEYGFLLFIRLIKGWIDGQSRGQTNWTSFQFGNVLVASTTLCTFGSSTHSNNALFEHIFACIYGL